MITRPSLEKAARALGNMLMLLPFLALPMVADGAMLKVTPHGITVELCSTDGPVMVELDPETGAPLAPAEETGREHCAWAAAQLAVVIPDPPGAAQQPAGRLRDTVFPALVAVTAGHPPLHAFARGPPTLA
jgi:hypothetical protein